MGASHRAESRREILRAIRKAGQLPRIELSARTGLSRATVTTITAELLTRGLLEEVACPTIPEPGRGRPRIDLKVRGAARLVAGVQVANQQLSLLLLDFEGKPVAATEAPLPRPVQSAAALSRQIRDALDRLCDKVDLTRTALAGAGIGVAGVVDADRSLVYWSPSLHERKVPLGEMLNRELGMPAFVDNDTNLVAVAEHLTGRARGQDDFLVVTIDSGVGLGVMIGGALYRGTRGCGTEFGHIKVQLDGALCRCGQRGCLEAYVADYALLREAAALFPETATDPPDHRLDQLLQAARDGNPAARAVTDRAGDFFAMGLANLVNIFDPSLIVLAGEQMRSDHLCNERVLAAMQRSVLRVDRPAPRIVTHEWGDMMWARGAAAYALDKVSGLALAEMADNTS